MFLPRPMHRAFSLTILHASWMQRLSRATQCERNWILDQAQTPNVCSKEGFKGGKLIEGGKAVTERQGRKASNSEGRTCSKQEAMHTTNSVSV